MAVLSTADLLLALDRVRQDHREGRVFVTSPVELSLIQHFRKQWVASLQKALASGSYSPAPALICDVPKGKGVVRAGVLLSLVDQVVYAACVGKCLASLRPTLRYGRHSKD